MISRPLVAAPVSGWIIGEPVAGMWVGILLELLTIRQLPIGGSRYWDAGPGAVVGAAALQALPPGPGALVLAAALGVAFGWAGGWTVALMRRVNARWVQPLSAGPVTPREVVVRHTSAMALDFGRAAALTAAGLIAGRLSGPRIDLVPSEVAPLAASVLLGATALALGSDIRTVATGRKVWAAFGLGALGSGILWLWLS